MSLVRFFSATLYLDSSSTLRNAKFRYESKSPETSIASIIPQGNPQFQEPIVLRFVVIAHQRLNNFFEVLSTKRQQNQSLEKLYNFDGFSLGLH